MCAVRSHWYLWTVPTDVTNKSPLIAGVGVLAGTEADGTLLMSNEHCWHRAPRGVWWDSRIAHVWPSLSSTHSFLLLLLRGLNFFISPLNLQSLSCFLCQPLSLLSRFCLLLLPLLFLFVAQAFAWNIFGCRLPVFDGIPFTSVPYWIVLRRGNENQGHFYRGMEVTLS